MMFIDLHCHILPQVDDGADSYIEACELITQAVDSGTKILTATPHINNRYQSKGHIKKSEIIEKYKQLKHIVEEKGIQATIFLGSELLAGTEISDLHNKNELITINGSRYILTEFSFDEQFKNVLIYCRELLSLGYIPLIAHPERYLFFSDSYERIYELFNIGCRFQINKGSPLGKYGESAQQIALRMLNDDVADIISSDCHSPSNRNSDMSEIYEWLLGRYPINKITEWTHDNAKRILLDLNI